MIDRPLTVRPDDGGESDSTLPRSWMATIARLRGICGLWLVAILALAFLPMPMRAQPPKMRTARRVSLETPALGIVESETEDAFPTEEEPTTARDGKNGRPPGLLVLKNGKLVEGQISQSAGGYVVDRPNGSLLVPFDRVSFEAEDRTDAYHKVRSKMPAKSAGSNLALARWCLSYDMLNEAEAELREALELEPHREEARTMLTRLEEIRNPDAPLNKQAPRHEAKTDDGFQALSAESLGGFSKETAQEFVTRVQPMLMNRCGNASCHGGRDSQANGFALILVKSGRSSRVSAERNLATVLHHLDLESPDRSPILTLARGDHGGAKALFHGPKATEQLDTLRDWVRKAAREEQARIGDAKSRPEIARAAATEVSRPMAAEHEPPVVTPAPETEYNPPIVPGTSPTSFPEPRRLRNGPAAPLGRAGSPARRPQPQSPQSDVVRKVLKEEQPDPFDPDEFNRAAPKK